MQVFNLCTLTVIIGVRIFTIMPDAAFRRLVILHLGVSGLRD